MQQFLNRVKIQSIRKQAWIGIALTATVVLLATVFPRLMVVGGLPMTDEGSYAYYAQAIHANFAAGKGLFDWGPLVLYPILVSCVFGLAANHLVLLRLVDMLVAIVASWLLCRVIEHESGSRVGGALISLVSLFTMNQNVFIDCGFKNSMFAAYVPLFLALRLGQCATSKAYVTWGLAGALAALAVLLRETFLHFFIVGAIAIVMTHGWRASLRFTLGAVVAGLLVTLGICAARGGIANLIAGYRNYGVFFAASVDQRVSLFISEGIISANEAMVALILGGLGIVSIVTGLFTHNRPVSPKHFTFWLFVALVPLLEPATKVGYAYHFAVCLPGIAGLAALGWKSAGTGSGASTKLRLAAFTVAVSVLLLLPKIIPLANSWPSTRDTLQSIGTGSWPSNQTEWSNYLLAAEAIRKVAPPNGTLGITDQMTALFPLTGLLPSSNDLHNLSTALLKLDGDEMRLTQALLACPPDVLMVTDRPMPTRNAHLHMKKIFYAVVDSGLYEPVASIPVDLRRSVGYFGGIVFKRDIQIQRPCDSKKAL